MSKLSIADLDFEGRRVFMRVDFNVPVKNGAVTDDTRIRAALPSILYIVEKGGRLILASHLGRPKGKPDPRYSLEPVRTHLSGLLGRPVQFASDCVGEAAATAVAALRDGGILLLENLRFHPEEERNDAAFSRELAALCDVYVNDAFGAAHRAHASTAGITAYVRPAAAGFLLQKELESLGRALQNVERPYVAIVGGAKVSDKIELLENLLGLADRILIGGAMSYTFLQAQGIATGKSLVEKDKIDLARELLVKSKQKGVPMELPVDHVVAAGLDAAEAETTPIDRTPPDRMGLDIGPETVRLYSGYIASARTVVWNGPMGVFENPMFAQGTFGVARAVAESNAFSIVGGGDSAAAVVQAGVASGVGHISTGGGATLEFLSGKQLPGVAALTDKADNAQREDQ